VGKVVRFPENAAQRVSIQPLAVLRPGQADKSVERALLKLFASLASAGVPELALDALIRWGEGRSRPVELLESVQSMAAVSGVRLPSFSEEGGQAEWFPS